MNAEFQLKLQAYLDGELSERETREIEALLVQDGEARGLVAELSNTCRALKAFEADVKLPESREFYWSKIQREIQRAEKPAAIRESGVPFWRKLLMPAGAFAAVAIAALLALQPFNTGTRPPQIETYLADSGAMTYRDEIEKTTVVWLSYPAENDFANPDAEDTID